jgi:PrtD family type I secretion system ABC transporter
MQQPTTNQLEQALIACKRAFLHVIFFGFIVSFLTLATSIYSLQVFDRVLSGGSYETLIALTIIMVIFSAVLNFIQGIRSSITYKISEYLDQKLSSLTIDLSFNSLKNDNSKQTISQNVRDLNTIRNFISSQSLISAIDAPWSLIFILVIFVIHPLLGVIVSVGALSLLFLAWINDILTKKLSAKSSEISNLSHKELDVMNKNVEVIAAMHMKNNLIKNWHGINDKSLKLAAQLQQKSTIVSNITKFIRSMIYVLMIAFGAVLVISDQMTSGGIMACSILSAKALAPFDAAISLWNGVLGTRKAYERLSKLIKDNYDEDDKITLPVPRGEVEIEKLGYVARKNSKPIIKGVNVSIVAGDIVAMIGPTAAGKSTLAKLAVGITNPSTGAVRLDGSELSHWKDEELANYIGYLPQDIELFNGSIKSNIARMDKKPDDKKVIEAAKMAHVHDMIIKLPKGYETDIGVWGSNISGGQRQRIALARAFYGDVKFVVLDEPNSNLDQDGEVALIKCLKMAKSKNITVLIISHRQQILEAVDKILVLCDGEAKFFGARDEVLKKLNQKSL